MTDRLDDAIEPSNHGTAVYAASLLRHYSFELGEYSADQLLTYWFSTYAADWVRLALVEALYQGRYKAISVGLFLAFWQRRGHPLYHFNHEFEHLVCDRLPRNLVPLMESERPKTEMYPTIAAQQPYRPVVPQLPGIRTLKAPPVATPLRSLAPDLPVASEPVASEPPILVDASQASDSQGGQSLDDQALPHVPTQPESNDSENLLAESDASRKRTLPDRHQTPEARLVLPNFAPLAGVPPAFGAVDGVGIGQSTLEHIAPDGQESALAKDEWESMAEPELHSLQNTESETQRRSAIDDSPPATGGGLKPETVDLELRGDLIEEQNFLVHREYTNAIVHDGNTLQTIGLNLQFAPNALSLKPVTLYQPNWLKRVASHHPIHQFTPAPEASDFCLKLKSVAENGEATV